MCVCTSDVSDVKIQRSADADVYADVKLTFSEDADTSFYKIADADVIFVRTADTDADANVENNAVDLRMRMQMQIFDTSLKHPNQSSLFKQ